MTSGGVDVDVYALAGDTVSWIATYRTCTTWGCDGEGEG
jgi:hypothetical protein